MTAAHGVWTFSAPKIVPPRYVCNLLARKLIDISKSCVFFSKGKRNEASFFMVSLNGQYGYIYFCSPSWIFLSMYITIFLCSVYEYSWDSTVPLAKISGLIARVDRIHKMRAATMHKVYCVSKTAHLRDLMCSLQYSNSNFVDAHASR